MFEFKEFIITILSIFTFVWIVDYMYVGIYDVFIDEDGYKYVVIDKNILYATIRNEYGQKRVPLLILCSRYIKSID